MSHLFVDISSHGFGHLAQTGPVLDALAARRPGLRLTIRSGLPESRLRTRIGADFTYLPGASDFGFAMTDATVVDRAASAVAYRDAHRDWSARVAAEADFLRRLSPDAVLANVSPLPLAGAAAAGICAAAMCSLNWADLFDHFFAGEDWAVPIAAELLAAYADAEIFLRLTPAMPMPALANVLDLPPLARRGRSRRGVVARAVAAAEGDRLLLVALGGIATRLPVESWPVLPSVRWLVPAAWDIRRTDCAAFEPLGLDFTDLLCSVDAVLTKPGYGTFVEAAANGIPVLWLRRDDWPEQDALIDWLGVHGRSVELPRAAVETGDFGDWLDRLWRQPAVPLPAADGAAAAAAAIDSLLAAGG